MKHLKMFPFVLIIAIIAACEQYAQSAPTSTETEPTESFPLPTSAATKTAAVAPPSPFSWDFLEIKMFDEGSSLSNMSGWAIAAAPNKEEYILHTSDGGKTWRISTLRSGDPYFLSSQIAWNWGGWGKQERTTDGGITWEPRHACWSEFFGGYHSCTFWDADHGMQTSINVAAGSAFVKLHATNDGGVTWAPFDFNLPGEIYSPSDGIIQCGCDGIYFDQFGMIIVEGHDSNGTFSEFVNVTVSRDHGQSWKRVKIPLNKTLRKLRSSRISVVFFDEKNGTLFIEAGGDNGAMPKFFVTFPFYTDDGGETWLPRTPTPTVADYQDDMAFLSPAEAIIHCGKDLCVTDDGARSWKLIHPDIDFQDSEDFYYQGVKTYSAVTNHLVNLNFPNSHIGFAILSSQPGVYRTTDGGNHWELFYPQVEEPTIPSWVGTPVEGYSLYSEKSLPRGVQNGDIVFGDNLYYFIWGNIKSRIWSLATLQDPQSLPDNKNTNPHLTGLTENPGSKYSYLALSPRGPAGGVFWINEVTQTKYSIKVIILSPEDLASISTAIGQQYFPFLVYSSEK